MMGLIGVTWTLWGYSLAFDVSIKAPEFGKGLESFIGRADTLQQQLDARATADGELRKQLEARELALKELQEKIAARDKAMNDLRNKLLSALQGYQDQDLTVEVKDGKVYLWAPTQSPGRSSAMVMLASLVVAVSW